MFIWLGLIWFLLLQFQDRFGVRHIKDKHHEMTAALYLQVSIVSQALIFVTRSRGWSYMERPGVLLLSAFFIAQLVGKWFHAYILPILVQYFYVQLKDVVDSVSQCLATRRGRKEKGRKRKVKNQEKWCSYGGPISNLKKLNFHILSHFFSCSGLRGKENPSLPFLPKKYKKHHFLSLPPPFSQILGEAKIGMLCY